MQPNQRKFALPAETLLHKLVRKQNVNKLALLPLPGFHRMHLITRCNFIEGFYFSGVLLFVFGQFFTKSSQPNAIPKYK